MQQSGGLLPPPARWQRSSICAIWRRCKRVSPLGILRKQNAASLATWYSAKAECKRVSPLGILRKHMIPLKIKSHATSTCAPLSKYAGQQPAYQSHVCHGTDGVGSNGTVSGSASHKIVIGKANQGTANGKQQWNQPIL